MRLLQKISGGTFFQIQTEIFYRLPGADFRFCWRNRRIFHGRPWLSPLFITYVFIKSQTHSFWSKFFARKEVSIAPKHDYWCESYIIDKSLEMTVVEPSTPEGRGTPGNSWWGCAARFFKSWPNFRPKNVIFHIRFQTRPLKSIPVFRPGL